MGPIYMAGLISTWPQRRCTSITAWPPLTLTVTQKGAIFIKLFKNDSSAHWGAAFLVDQDDCGWKYKGEREISGCHLPIKEEGSVWSNLQCTNEEPENHKWEGTQWNPCNSVNHGWSTVLRCYTYMISVNPYNNLIEQTMTFLSHQWGNGGFRSKLGGNIPLAYTRCVGAA